MTPPKQKKFWSWTPTKKNWTEKKKEKKSLDPLKKGHTYHWIHLSNLDMKISQKNPITRVNVLLGINPNDRIES